MALRFKAKDYNKGKNKLIFWRLKSRFLKCTCQSSRLCKSCCRKPYRLRRTNNGLSRLRRLRYNMMHNCSLSNHSICPTTFSWSSKTSPCGKRVSTLQVVRCPSWSLHIWIQRLWIKVKHFRCTTLLLTDRPKLHQVHEPPRFRYKY